MYKPRKLTSCLFILLLLLPGLLLADAGDSRRDIDPVSATLPAPGDSDSSRAAGIAGQEPAAGSVPSSSPAPRPARVVPKPVPADPAAREVVQDSAEQVPVMPASPERGTYLAGSNVPTPPEQRHAKSRQQAGIIYDELLASSTDMASAEQQRRQLAGFGLSVKSRKQLPGLGMVISVYRVPLQSDYAAFIQALHESLPELGAEYNRRYTLQQSAAVPATAARQYARRLTGLQQSGQNGEGLQLAMLDAPVDVGHPALVAASIVVQDMTGQDMPGQVPSVSTHGTAIASLLVGSETVNGALSSAQLLAINIFARDTGDDGKWYTRTDWWLRGLNQLALASPQPAVVNMSFGGEYSALVASALRVLAARDINLVAAVGNNGASAPVLFPASLDFVVSATAIDVDRQLYKQAPQKLPGLALSAPGVDVWAADSNGGGYYASGSSFAAPWVSATLALAGTGTQAIERIIENAIDLGDAGYDPLFGAGLVYQKK